MLRKIATLLLVLSLTLLPAAMAEAAPAVIRAPLALRLAYDAEC